MICVNCGNEFIAKRSTAKFCGARCRKLAFRERDAKITVPAVSVAPAVLSVPKDATVQIRRQFDNRDYYKDLSPSVRQRVLDELASRPGWARLSWARKRRQLSKALCDKRGNIQVAEAEIAP